MTTYYVDITNPNASDDGPGTWDKPFRTWRRAQEEISKGSAAMSKGKGGCTIRIMHPIDVNEDDGDQPGGNVSE